MRPEEDVLGGVFLRRVLKQSTDNVERSWWHSSSEFPTILYVKVSFDSLLFCLTAKSRM